MAGADKFLLALTEAFPLFYSSSQLSQQQEPINTNETFGQSFMKGGILRQIRKQYISKVNGIQEVPGRPKAPRNRQESPKASDDQKRVKYEPIPIDDMEEEFKEQDIQIAENIPALIVPIVEETPQGDLYIASNDPEIPEQNPSVIGENDHEIPLEEQIERELPNYNLAELTVLYAGLKHLLKMDGIKAKFNETNIMNRVEQVPEATIKEYEEFEKQLPRPRKGCRRYQKKVNGVLKYFEICEDGAHVGLNNLL